MNYEESLQYINQLNSRGISLGLERITALLEFLGNPQDTLRCIHVAGTNGKGSVCAFLDSVLQKAGLTVGRYISPTLYDYRERMQINGQWIAEDDLASVLTAVRAACDRMAEQNMELPTVFEVETAAAFLYFQQKQCDYVLLEVGMGGRLDSTNVIKKPALSVIASISLDHTAMLGDSLAAIAEEKGGIIKSGCPVVIGPQRQEAMDVLLKCCERCSVTPALTDANGVQRKEWSIEGQIFSYKNWPNTHISLLGDYQCSNAAIALEALQILQKEQPVLSPEVILEGLKEAKWPGRFEVIHKKPLVIVDGAHNPAGAEALAETLQHFADRQIILLMAVFKDKQYTEIARLMSRCSDQICCFPTKEARGLDAAMLAEAVKPFYKHVRVADSAEDAIGQAFEQISGNDKENDAIVVSFGTLSMIDDVHSAVKRRATQEEVQHGTKS